MTSSRKTKNKISSPGLPMYQICHLRKISQNHSKRILDSVNASKVDKKEIVLGMTKNHAITNRNS